MIDLLNPTWKSIQQRDNFHHLAMGDLMEHPDLPDRYPVCSVFRTEHLNVNFFVYMVNTNEYYRKIYVDKSAYLVMSISDDNIFRMMGRIDQHEEAVWDKNGCFGSHGETLKNVLDTALEY